MNAPETRRATFEALAAEWERQGLETGVLHGLERYPAEVGRDLDVCIREDQTELAIRLTRDLLEAEGWKVVALSRPWAHWVFAFRNLATEPEGLEIDFLPMMQTGVLRLLDGPSPHRTRKGPFCIDSWGGVVKRILMQLYAGNRDRFRRCPEELTIQADEQSAIADMLPKFFASGAPRLEAALKRENPVELEEIIRQTRLKTQIRSLVTGQGRLRHAVFCLHRWVGLNLRPRRVAPLIAVVGPDGVGKSTTLRSLEECFVRLNVFPARIQRHWRPGLFPPLHEAWKPSSWMRRRKDEGPAQDPRRTAGKLRLVRSWYYFLDFWLGHWLLDARASVRLNPVIYDRHAVDMTIDPVRYGLSAPFPKILQRLIPRPDLVIALVDHPENIRARKQELSIGEIQDQLSRIEHLHSEGHIDRMLSVQATPEETAATLLRELLNHFCSRQV